MWTHRLCAIAIAISVTASSAMAEGVVILQKETSGGKVTNNQVLMDGDKMRAETATPDGRMAMIFDGTRQVMLMVNLDKKSYTELTKADLDRLGGQVNDAMAQMRAQMEEQMKGMPPEQRKMVEEMMKGRMGNMPGMGGGAPPAKAEYRKTGSDKVGQWNCDKYEAYANDQKTAELCTVDPKDLGLTASDFEAARQMAEFFKKMMPQEAGRMITAGKTEVEGFSGVPVRHITFNGNRQTVSEITEIRRESIPASTFAAPAGFKKEAFNTGGRR